GSYDAAPLPVVAYLSTVSKLGGLTAVVLVAVGVFGSQLGHVAVVFAVVAVASMTLGNLAALRQLRLSRLLAWSSIAQLGYALAPLGALGSTVSGDDAARHAVRQLVAGSLGYLVLYLAVTLGLLAALVAIRAPRDDGGSLDDLRGLAYRRPWLCAGLLFGLAGLAGLPPALAGMFAKLAVLHALLEAGAAWLAVVVVCNAVVGLAVYGRLVRSCFRRSVPDAGSDGERPTERSRLPVSVALSLTVAVAIVGVVPEPIFDVCDRIAGALTELLI
ncbi:MAG TPA: proton-conducting transporter membrane subunit, partial [Mycobacteriales bacterium]|nr:proton-conducting transporter membrane subunit [Mycobacteriales bacterium]